MPSLISFVPDLSSYRGRMVRRSLHLLLIRVIYAISAYKTNQRLNGGNSSDLHIIITSALQNGCRSRTESVCENQILDIIHGHCHRFLSSVPVFN